ncbi:MAG: YihA family ribosome biogenesis GTP-binding protein [Betaproteobacteria bacterium]|nr:YihA family ribosome biogenesis GTP-binding protein [Betaproteobacteria bacterium]
MKLFTHAVFVASAGTPNQFPPQGLPEVAFLGRSNVGKSSAINALTGRRRLAFVSKTPGRTQAVNFYELDGVAMFVDLPGYGYARVPQALRAGWDRLVRSYLETRSSLVGVVVLLDARRPLTPQDRGLFEWIDPLRVKRLVLLVKADKLGRAARAAALQDARRALAAGKGDVLLFSSTHGEGVEEARERLAEWLRAPGGASPE